MIHADLNNLQVFGQLTPRYYVTDKSKYSTIYGKIGLKNDVWLVDTYAEPSIDNANPDYQSYGIGFEASMKIDYAKIHVYIEPWDYDEYNKTQIAAGGDVLITGKYLSIGAGYDHNSVVKGHFQNAYRVIQGFDYKVLHIQLFEGISDLYDSKALFGGQIEADITNNVSIYAKDSVYVGSLNKLETGINVKF